MTKQTQHHDDEHTKIAEAINGWGEIKARQISIHGWRVLSWRNDGLTAYEVDLRELSCTCEDMQYNSQDDREEDEICDHLAVALFQADRTMDVGEALNYELNQQVTELNQHVEAIERRSAAVQASTAGMDDSGAERAEDSSDGDADDGETVLQMDPTMEQEGKMEELEDWFDQAAEFNDFDPEIIRLSWVEADGTPGVEVDRQPFDSGYYDTDAGEWEDKDAFDEQKERIKDTVLSARDEFDWFGEPDYSWFIAEEDILEVAG